MLLRDSALLIRLSITMFVLSKLPTSGTTLEAPRNVGSRFVGTDYNIAVRNGGILLCKPGTRLASQPTRLAPQLDRPFARRYHDLLLTTKLQSLSQRSPFVALNFS